MKPHIFRVKDGRGEWYLIHDGKRSAETGLGASELDARRLWELSHGIPPDGYAWVPGACTSAKHVAALLAQASERAGDTVRLVPLADHVALARLGLAMRKAQAAYFDKRKKTPHVSAEAEYRIARQAEGRFESAARAVLQREQGTLPGMAVDD